MAAFNASSTASLMAEEPSSPPLLLPSRASLRWQILRRALLSRTSHAPAPSQLGGDSSRFNTKNISRKVAGGFKLIPCVPLNGHLKENQCDQRDAFVCYQLPVEGNPKLTLVHRTEDSIDFRDFDISTRYDIDTTGLICSWPSEEVLAYFCMNHGGIFRSKRVLELGSGFGLAGMVVAATTDACEVVISDGNPEVVNYIKRNIYLNSGIYGDTEVQPLALHWNQEHASNMLNSFDIIIASDCTFFKDFHESLANTIKLLLKNSEDSEAIFFSPRRGNSLDRFLEKIKETGLEFLLVENYDDKVSSLHQKFLNGVDTSWPNYEKDHCYPIMIKIGFNRLLV
ncbi:Calmodulin-lysine N-methyltransferase protein [Dioscorea alata]|uniref:Calmodulin-lysine N-methyltransferase protein n=1 Tax=Dioscorea alata TaxID=55571 RepID=A0ACB7V6M5_DIOAL|nr:Calmodulin-lysine N-methyltransferase protein [Dioscorea alata]